MKLIKLMNLKLTNFKGIKSFELDAQGTNLKVFGANATGKTSVFDAFVWLLFDKDSENVSTSNFGIKTLVDGKPISKINHEVEAELVVDDKILTLKKVYKEKWTKKRGSSIENFTGHTTDYYVNGVPGNKKDYDKTINELVDENVFKLLTDPTHFNKTHWKEQREVLIDIAGNISDEEVIATNKDLEMLLDILNGNSIDDHKKIIASKRKEINKEIDRIPIRIDELNRNIPDVTGLKEIDINSSIELLNGKIEAKNNKLNDLKNGTETINVKHEINEIENELSKVESSHVTEQEQELLKLKTRLSEEETNLQLMRGEVKPLMQDKETTQREISNIKNYMDQLRDDYSLVVQREKELSVKEFDNHATNCPTCAQILPEEEVEKLVSDFNKDKSDKLEECAADKERINKKGVELKEKLIKLEEEIPLIDKKIEEATEQGKKKDNDIKKLKTKVSEAESKVIPVTENVDYIKYSEQIKALNKKAVKLSESVSDETLNIKSELDELEKEKEVLRAELSKLEQVKQADVRIKELEENERILATEYENLEYQLHLTEEFTRKKVEMLTENINNKFKYARFNLFKENINGGLEEICESTYKGVPFTEGLNKAAQINVGLDIINTLSKHYGVQAPIFVDNAESITDLIDVDTQLISLIVSKDDKVLRVESKEVTEKEVA